MKNSHNELKIFNESIDPYDHDFIETSKKIRNGQVVPCVVVMILSAIMSFSVGMAVAEKKNITDWLVYAAVDVFSIFYGVYLFVSSANKAAFLDTAVKAAKTTSMAKNLENIQSFLNENDVDDMKEKSTLPKSTMK